jgi:peroxiredoxin
MAFTLELGKSPPDFNLPGVDGRNYSPASFKDAKILVVLFTCNHCPYVVGSEDRMIEFYNDYKDKGVAMIGINSNETVGHPTDSFEHMVGHAKDKGFQWPYVRDDSQEIALAYGALRTPHYYVFDRDEKGDRKLRYTGRMDDNPRNPGQEKTHELRDAVDAILAGKKPPVEMTNPIGCNVKWQGKERHWMPPEACDLV